MYTTNNPRDYSCEHQSNQISTINQKHSVLPKMRSRHLPTLLLYIRQLIARFSVRFLPFQSITQQSTQHSNNSYNEQSTEKHPNLKTESIQRCRSFVHLRLRQEQRETMSERTDQDVEQKSRSDNYRYQIIKTTEHFLSLIPSDFITYQLSIIFRRDSLNNTAYRKPSVQTAIENIYKRLNETFVHKRRYAQDPHRQFMPYLLSMIELDDKVLFHCHALLAVHPDHATKFDELCAYDTFKQFHESVLSSHFSRTIEDDKDVQNFDEPTNVSKWVNYLLKQNKNKTPKKPEDLLLFAPKQ